MINIIISIIQSFHHLFYFSAISICLEPKDSSFAFLLYHVSVLLGCTMLENENWINCFFLKQHDMSDRIHISKGYKQRPIKILSKFQVCPLIKRLILQLKCMWNGLAHSHPYYTREFPFYYQGQVSFMWKVSRLLKESRVTMTIYYSSMKNSKHKGCF